MEQDDYINWCQYFTPYVYDDNYEKPAAMMYRLYNPNAQSGAHHYTMSEEERDNLVSVGWKYEGIGWFGL